MLSYKYQLLKGCNDLLSAIYKTFFVPGSHVSFSFAQKVSQLTRFFNSIGVKRMLERKGYAVLDTVPLFIAAFLDSRIGFGDNPVLATLHMCHPDTLKQLLHTQPNKRKPTYWRDYHK